MFADPQTITISASPKTLNRTGFGQDAGSFATGDQAHRLTVSHSYGKRVRRVVKLSQATLVANPLIAGQNVSQLAMVHIVFDAPPGYDTTAQKAMVDGFLAYLSASSGAAVTKVLGGES